MDSPKKASVKHLQFQLQREKALTEELGSKCKTFQSQIAQLEQDKAELRREKLALVEETKKSQRLDERVHALQKELETREEIINQERARVAEAKSETEVVRFNANESIASWKCAENQWVAEQEALNETISSLEKAAAASRKTLASTEAELQDTQSLLEKEKYRSTKLDASQKTSEDALRTMNEKVAKLQNRVFDLERQRYNLDQAGEKQREALNLKDTEIKTLEATVAKHVTMVESMDQKVNSLNDEINAAKMVNLKSKEEIEKLLYDVSEAKKERDSFALQVESLSHDQDFATQTQESLQKSYEELREKYRREQESVKQRSIEIRQHELTISELKIKIEKLEGVSCETGFQCNSLEAALSERKEEVKRAQAVRDDLTKECSSLKDGIKALQAVVEQKNEELVLLQSQMDDGVEELKREIQSWKEAVDGRQNVIQELTAQLGSTNEKNAMYQGKFLEESEATVRLRQQVKQLHTSAQEQERSLLLSECLAGKRDAAVALYQEFLDAIAHHVADVRTKWAAQTVLAIERQGALLVEEARVKELESLCEAQSTSQENLQRELQDCQNKLSHAEQSLTEAESRRLSLLQKRKIGQDENSSLQLTVDDLQHQLSERAAEVNTLLSGNETQRQQLSFLVERSLMHFDGLAETQELWWRERVAVLCSYLSSAAAEKSAAVTEIIGERETMEQRCKELTALLEEAKAANSRKGVALAEKQGAQQARVQTLESQLQALQDEKDQTSFQLSTLLARFETEQKSNEQDRRDAERALKAEQRTCQEASKQCAKLRSAVEYEVKRKGEYKAALEAAKRLRDDTDNFRVKEKALATEAIHKANAETMYWVECFEKLKAMTDKCQREGARIPSVDPDTLSRLASAKSGSAAPLHDHCVNAHDRDGSSDRRLKRLRVDNQQ